MLEKDNISMATVQIKPEYAASEVYSTTSEAPPLGFLTYTTQQAYKRQSNSVKIAKITAFTIIVSSFVLGSFILASSYLQAKASCDQVQALDSVLEKELMLETLQQVNKELPRAEALMGKEVIIDADLQNLDKEEQPIIKKEVKQTLKSDTGDAATEVSNEVDNNYTDSEEAIDLQKYSGKVPLELDLSELAAALLQSNKKSRMNCVVERKHAEEIVDSPSKMVSLPFGMNLKTDPKKARITGERISIFCEGGNEKKETKENRESNSDDDTEEDTGANVRPIFIPYQRLPTHFGQMPQQFPLTHMPQRMMPPMSGGHIPQQQPFQHPLMGQSPTFQQVPMRTHMSPPMMQSPNPESQQQTLRIHVQQIPFREIHMAEDLPMHIPSQNQELPRFQIQRVPLDLALQRAGITAEDLQKIQRMAEDRITDEFRRFVAEEDVNTGAENNNSSEEDDESSPQNSGDLDQLQRQQQDKHIENDYSIEQTKRLEKPQQIEQNVIQRLILQKLPEQPRDTMTPPIQDQPQPMLHFGRDAFGRSLAQPVRIPVPMMQAQADLTQDVAVENRRTVLQPRTLLV